MPDDSASKEINRLDRGIAAGFQPVHDATATRERPNPGEQPGARIGPYKLLQEIGEGGFGTVYMAEQLEPVRRKVALKIIKPGMDTRNVIARFEAERQALAMMDHANIARVLDAGATENGRPYFVMELIKGVPITEFCDRNKFDTAKRLELFMTVCNAVQHAHQKGIIHRDLKPSNVMVTLNDGNPVPKVIDFGVSKAISQHLTEKTLFTHYGQMIGTPQYMSPEQAEMSELDIDTRSDIYSLGVLLYELLTGTTPLEASRLRTAGYSEMLRMIQHEDAARPSTRLSTLGESLTIVCEHRKTDAKRLRQLIRGDLDWIVVKALDKHRDRRYETANGLAADIMRHLHNEPVVARPPSTAYKLQKAWRRNKVAFAASVAVIGALSIGLIASTWSLVEAHRQQGIAQRERDDAIVARRTADEATRNADTARELAEAESARADAQAEQLRRQVYVYHVTRAGSAFERKNAPLLREMLDACPEELRGWEWNRLQRLADRSRRTLKGHDGPVLWGTYSPDGSRIASGGGDGAVRIWEAATGEASQVLQGDEDEVLTVAFSPDGSKLVSGSRDKSIKLWNVDNGTLIRTLRGHEGLVSSVAFSPDGIRIVSGSEDATVRVWDVATARELLKLGGHKGPVQSVAISPDGEYIASGGGSLDGELILWESDTGRRLKTVNAHGIAGEGGISLWAGAIHGLAFSPAGNDRIVSSGEDKTLRLWNFKTGALVREMTGHEDTIRSVAFSPDGKRIASASLDNTLRLWDGATGKELATLLGHTGPVTSVAFSPDGGQIVSGSEDDTLRLWDTHDDLDVLTLLRGHAGTTMRGVAFSPDGRYLASAGFDTARIWDVVTGEEVRNLHGHLGGVFAIAYSPDGRYVATGGGDTTMKLWDAHTGRELKTFRGHTALVNHVAFSPDSKRVASVGNTDGTVRIWDVAADPELPPLNTFKQKGFAEGVAFSPDGKLLASCSRFGEGAVKLWNTTDGSTVRTFPGLGDGSRWVSFSAGGTQLIVGCADGTIRFLDLTSGENFRTLRGYGGYVRCLAVTSDGQRIVAGSQDGSVKVWHAVTGEELLTLRGHETTVWCVAISPDGKTIASTSNDATLLWETGPPGYAYESPGM